MTLAFSLAHDAVLLHEARSLDRALDSAQAHSLLDEIATQPCRFAAALPDRPLALYGAGNLGRVARDFLAAVGHDFSMVIDRNARGLVDDPEWSGIRLLHPRDVPVGAKRRACLLVCIATVPYVPLEEFLFGLGFEHIVPFYDLAESFRYLHPLSNGWFAAPLETQDRENTAKVLDRWDDDTSRAHHLQFLAWRRLREEWTFVRAPVFDGPRFFIPEVASALHRKEVFLDAGAHYGSVTRTFVEQTKGQFRAIIAIEPDPWNRARLTQALRPLSLDKRLSILNCALGEHDGEEWFHDGLGYASQVSDSGEMRITVRPVDALGLSPTFIKLHLEGGELAALKGARRTLLSCRPLIAATVYHNADGIWRTALWLTETLPDYRFLFRLHSWCGTGAVIYAIPKERSGRE
jgi:FkbM family methyltransferase